MPIVPTFNNNLPNVLDNGRPMGQPVQNVSPQFDYESVMNRAMQPINQFADSVVKLEAHYHDTVVKARADEQLNAYNKEVQNQLYNLEDGYFTQQGKTAVENWDSTQSKLQDIYNRHLESIDDPDVKEAFKSNALQRLSATREKTILYRNQQNQQFIANTSKAKVDNLIEDFAVNGFGPESERTISSILNEIDYQARIQGQGQEWVKAQKNNYVSLAYAAAYQNMVQTDPEGALRHYQTVGSKTMNAETGRRVFGMLYEASAPEIRNKIQAMGGTSYLSLTPGAVSVNSKDTVSAVANRQRQAQQGLGTPPKVSDKVLNTSGYKGCNPLNIRAGGDKWQGAIGQTDNGYLIFSTPQDGIRAATKVLQTYSKKYGINTVSEIISRFAPASENPTDSYIANVCKTLKVKPDEALNLESPETMRRLIKAMMTQEIGGVAYSDRTINDGVLRALGREDTRDYSDLYNTKLTDEEEKQYQQWAKSIGHERDVYDYDLRGAWKAGAAQAENGHFPDTFKKPNHETFSNESQYHNGTTRVGGHWEKRDGQNVFVGANGELRDDNGKPIGAETAQTAQATTPKLTASDLALNPNVRTGYDVFDNLPTPYKLRLLGSVKQQSGQTMAAQKNELNVSVKNALAVARNTGDISQVPEFDSFVQVYGQLEGIKQYEEAQKQAQFNANLFSATSMSVDEMNAMSKSLTPEKDDPNYAKRMSEKDEFDKACVQITKQRIADPIQYANQAIPNLNLQPINKWENQAAVVAEIKKRAQSADDIAKRMGSKPSIFSKAEVADFIRYMGTLDAKSQGAYIQMLSQNIFADNQNGEAMAIIAEQFGDKKLSYITAFGLSSTENGLNNNLAERQIQGAYYRDQKIGAGYKEETSVREQLAGILPTGPDSLQNELMVEAVMNEHCHALATGESPDISKSIEKTIGKVQEFNGKKILLPSLMSELDIPWYKSTRGTFEKLLSEWSKGQKDKTILVGGVVVNPLELDSLIRSSQLQTVTDGRYRVVNGMFYVTDKNGQPITIDLNPIIDKRKK